MLAAILILSPVCGFRPSGQIPTLAGMVTLAPKDRDLPILKKANQDNLQIIDIGGGLFVCCAIPSVVAAVIFLPTLPRWAASTKTGGRRRGHL
jgi:hypothetical protein